MSCNVSISGLDGKVKVLCLDTSVQTLGQLKCWLKSNQQLDDKLHKLVFDGVNQDGRGVTSYLDSLGDHYLIHDITPEKDLLLYTQNKTELEIYYSFMFEEMRQKLNQLSTEKDLRSELKAMKTSIETISDENQVLRQELVSMKATIETKDKEINGLKDELKAINNRLENDLPFLRQLLIASQNSCLSTNGSNDMLSEVLKQCKLTNSLLNEMKDRAMTADDDSIVSFGGQSASDILVMDRT